MGHPVRRIAEDDALRQRDPVGEVQAKIVRDGPRAPRRRVGQHDPDVTVVHPAGLVGDAEPPPQKLGHLGERLAARLPVLHAEHQQREFLAGPIGAGPFALEHPVKLPRGIEATKTGCP